MAEPLPLRIRRLMAAHTTLTLATVSPDGLPQAVPLFYAEADDLSLILVSETTVRHSRNLAERPQASAAIAADDQEWDRIQGLQLEGECRLLREDEAGAAREVYLAKFPFIAHNDALGRRLRASGIYRFRPGWIRLIDNTLGFGFKEELKLSP
ncbi:MAG: pyridoxamine 5'-phosphate oxidase family protein [bacterium]